MCIKCRSVRLKIKRATGIERFMAMFTRKRKFLCAYCGYTFRAVDRRHVPREANAFAAEVLVLIIPSHPGLARLGQRCPGSLQRPGGASRRGSASPQRPGQLLGAGSAAAVVG